MGCGYATGVAAWPSQAPNRRLLPMRRNTRSGRFSTLLIGWNLPQQVEYSPSAAILPMGLILSETLRRGRPSAGTPPSTMPGTEPRPTPFVLSFLFRHASSRPDSTVSPPQPRHLRLCHSMTLQPRVSARASSLTPAPRGGLHIVSYPTTVCRKTTTSRRMP